MFPPVAVHEAKIAIFQYLPRAVQHHVEFVKTEVGTLCCKRLLACGQHDNNSLVQVLFAHVETW